MKLSELIREGAKRYPIKETLYMFNEREINGKNVIGCCAIGAARLAVMEFPESLKGFDTYEAIWRLKGHIGYDIDSEVPELELLQDGSNFVSLRSWIINANDRLCWSREAIADELERVGL